MRVDMSFGHLIYWVFCHFIGKSRRIIFKKSATRAPAAVARAVTSDRVYYRGQYYTKGNFWRCWCFSESENFDTFQQGFEFSNLGAENP